MPRYPKYDNFLMNELILEYLGEFKTFENEVGLWDNLSHAKAVPLDRCTKLWLIRVRSCVREGSFTI